MNGPVPRSCFVGSNVPAVSSFIGRIEALGWVSAASSDDRGWARVIVTCHGPVAAMLLTFPSCVAQYEPVFGLTRRCRLPTTSSVVSCLPFENFAFCLIVNTYVVGEVC